MKRYVDVDLLKSELKGLNGSERLYYMGMFDVINSQPAADVEEVVHGKWIDETGTFYTVAGVRRTVIIGYKCSVCGHNEIEKYPFCNCGARMDK